MLVEVLKPFVFSCDGINGEQQAIGAVVDLPDLYIAGLVAEGFVRAVQEPQKENKFAPAENKAELAASENKRKAWK